MYCRYCFRKVGINDGPVRLHRAAEQALKYISEHTEVREVILSGGDPLMLSDGILESLRKAIEAIGHIDRLRIHSRTPVTFPDRMTEGLMDALDARIEVVMVTHFNHPTEITDRVIRGLRRFQETGIQLANQSVLLRGVNDDPRILAALCGQLVAIGVRPYYLHHLDAAPGTHHFRVSIEEGLAIYRSAISKLPVSDRPRYMLDMPGGGGKIPVDSAAVKAVDSTGLYRLTSPIDGHSILWQDPSLLQPVSVPHLV